jgi:hypothetical protein
MTDTANIKTPNYNFVVQCFVPEHKMKVKMLKFSFPDETSYIVTIRLVSVIKSRDVCSKAVGFLW